MDQSVIAALPFPCPQTLNPSSPALEHHRAGLQILQLHRLTATPFAMVTLFRNAVEGTQQLCTTIRLSLAIPQLFEEPTVMAMSAATTMSPLVPHTSRCRLPARKLVKLTVDSSDTLSPIGLVSTRIQEQLVDAVPKFSLDCKSQSPTVTSDATGDQQRKYYRSRLGRLSSLPVPHIEYC